MLADGTDAVKDINAMALQTLSLKTVDSFAPKAGHA